MAICAFIVAGLYLFWLNTIYWFTYLHTANKKLHAYILVLSILYCIAGYFRRALILWFCVQIIYAQKSKKLMFMVYTFLE